MFGQVIKVRPAGAHTAPVVVNVYVKGTHSGKVAGITGETSTCACTGWVFSAIPPIASVNETIMPR
ncbi:MAG: hypothetical protein WCP43_05670, partial [Dehalococcoidia bacterium]